MRISYDQAKNDRNIKERQLSFDKVVHFDFETALITVDDRKEYGEKRYAALGLLDNRVHALEFTFTHSYCQLP